MVEHRAKRVAHVAAADCPFHRLADGAAEASCVFGVAQKDVSPCLRGIARAFYHLCAVGFHENAPIGFLRGAYFYHVHSKIKPVVRAGHGKRTPPLPRAGFRGKARYPLLLCKKRLRRSGVELVAARGVTALKFEVDLRGRIKLFFKVVGAHERRGAEGAVIVNNPAGYGDVAVGIVEFLLHGLFTKHGKKLFFLKRF